MTRIAQDYFETHISEILSRVEHGEFIVITRGENEIARLTPVAKPDTMPIEEIITEFREIRKKTKPTTAEEILAWRDEGRK